MTSTPLILGRSVVALAALSALHAVGGAAFAQPQFVPSSYIASVGTTPASNPFSSPISSDTTTDINTALFAFPWASVSHWGGPPNAMLTVFVSALPFNYPTEFGREAYAQMTFTVDAPAVLTVNWAFDIDMYSGSGGYLANSDYSTFLLRAYEETSGTASVTLEPGEVYHLSLYCVNYNHGGSSITATLTSPEPVPTPGAAALLGLGGVAMMRRRRA